MSLHIALSLDQKGSVNNVGTYSWQHELVQEVALPDSLYTTGEVLSMPEALLAGRFKNNDEMALKTKLPEIKFPYERKPQATSYVLKQTEKLYLDHPKNQAYFQPEQELSALLVEAVGEGAVNKVYASDSLLTIMSKANWKDNLKVKEYDTLGDGYTLSMDNYLPQQLSGVEVNWKLQVDGAGNVISKTPYALGLYLGANSASSGLVSLIGYLSYEELYQSAKYSYACSILSAIFRHLSKSPSIPILSRSNLRRC